jgi:LPS-assembly protein
MKNNLILVFFLFFFQHSLAENLNIKSSKISINKTTKLSIFEDNVVVTDVKNNIFKTNYAEYDKNIQLLKSKGKTTITTAEGFLLSGNNIDFDNNNEIIKSTYPATIQDLENNKIYLESFEYSTKNNFFKSAGKIKVVDLKNNVYNFTQIYIDEKKKEIIGTDSKAFLNDENFKIHKNNKPRIFANTVKIEGNQSQFNKSVFTFCDHRENDKCPPWSLQASKITHDKKKKTIYYDNAVIKVYDLPIFYIPKISHPDPTVDRRSGFLTPSFSNSKNLGSGFEIPYFWAISKEKDFTLSNKLFASENPLFLGEYRQVFQNSNLIFDFGYTEGYKKTTITKKAGDKSHYFSKFVKSFKNSNDSESNLEISLQEVSDDKYLKLYKIKTDLVDYQTSTLENSLEFTHANRDSFLGLKTSRYETLKDTYNDKYEYILPEVFFDKNLFSNNTYGSGDLTSNLKIHNYDTNKFTKFFVNDLDWKFKNFDYPSGFSGKVLGKLKNVNYEAKNVTEYKKDTTHELFGALGYLTEMGLYKNSNNGANQLLTPKILFRYAPGHMRKQSIDNGSRLNHLSVFSLDRLNSYNNFESGLSTTLGFEYEIKNKDKQFDLVMGQVINEKENKDMPSSSSLDEKLSDVVASSNLKINENFKFNYNFALDQNYKQLNYNEIGTDININSVSFNFNYLQEKEHIGNQEYFNTKIDYARNENGLFSAETKRNLITNSSEFYNLSYEYINDCLRAGLVYRREFYNDAELEPDNSLMFTISLVPFGNINSPSFNK